jgi:RNA polymerase sigma-70 factor (ECF subfamily)
MRGTGGIAAPEVRNPQWAHKTGAQRVADVAAPSADAARPQDAWVLAIARGRDRAAFVALYEYYAPRLKSYLLRLGAADAAEEMAQETMLMVWRKATQFDPQRASAGTWIFTIARNLYIDRKRKERRPEIDPSDPMLVSDNDPAADTALAMRQSEHLVRAALATLPPEQAQVIELSFFADKAHAVIAAELKLPLGTVKSRLRLAMARLRAGLDGALSEAPRKAAGEKP